MTAADRRVALSTLRAPMHLCQLRVALVFACLSFACAGPRTSESTPTPTPTPTPADPSPEPATTVPNSTLVLHPELARYVESLQPELATIPDERKQTLDQIAEFVQTERAAGRTAKLVFICTHNSRRSHMSQIWATTAAAWYGVEGVEAYSGGTEATAFNPRAVAALQRAGFALEAPPEGDNPHYLLDYSPERPPIEAFSKVFSTPSNPQAEFAAILNCSEADKACPFVAGASLRISLAYDDPKQADGTPAEQARYDERCRQIADEMFYLFSKVGA